MRQKSSVLVALYMCFELEITAGVSLLAPDLASNYSSLNYQIFGGYLPATILSNFSQSSYQKTDSESEGDYYNIALIHSYSLLLLYNQTGRVRPLLTSSYSLLEPKSFANSSN